MISNVCPTMLHVQHATGMSNMLLDMSNTCPTMQHSSSSAYSQETAGQKSARIP